MKTATVTLESVSPYSQSRKLSEIEIPKLPKESAGDYDVRNWRQKQHYNRETGQVYIPPTALKNCLMEAAQYLGEKIPGKGNATWTKHFTAGVMCSEPVYIGAKWDEVESETFECHSDGKRSCGQRVPRTFPVVRSWVGTAVFYILDDTITREVFEKYLEEAGKFIGIGRFRPRNGGFYGRFMVNDVKWS